MKGKEIGMDVTQYGDFHETSADPWIGKGSV
jgi:hypothetical protein